MKWILTESEKEKMKELIDRINEAQTIREIQYYRKQIDRILKEAKSRKNEEAAAISAL